jgi:hypothetical protein
MGPTHVNFRKVVRNGEKRVYLSEAEAAMLSRHPAFRGVRDDRGQLPKVEVQGMKYVANPQTKNVVVSGQVRASRPVVYALVADESQARPGEYWTKTYVGKITPDGTFEVVITEPSESDGTLKTWFVFEDGAQTGDGKSRGRDSGVAKAYTFSNGQWVFR